MVEVLTKEWLTVTESSRIVGVSVGQMRKIVRDGGLPARDVKQIGPRGRTMYYLRGAAVHRYAAENPGGGKGRPRGPLHRAGAR